MATVRKLKKKQLLLSPRQYSYYFLLWMNVCVHVCSCRFVQVALLHALDWIIFFSHTMHMIADDWKFGITENDIWINNFPARSEPVYSDICLFCENEKCDDVLRHYVCICMLLYLLNLMNSFVCLFKILCILVYATLTANARVYSFFFFIVICRIRAWNKW